MKTYQDYFDTLGFKESSSVPDGVQNYAIENAFGFIGKYQFGEAALFDLGYYGTDGSDNNLFKNNWTGNWSGKNGIASKQDYFNNGAVQEIIIRDWQEILWGRIQFLELDKYVDQTLNGQLITASGMLAAAHLIGAGSRSSDTAGLKGFLLSGAELSPKDGNGVSANDYMQAFSGFETPFLIDHSIPESIAGGSGKDILIGFGGNDILNGKAATDTAVYHGQQMDFGVEKLENGNWTINHFNNGAEGIDTLIDIERVAFSDGLLALDLDAHAGITAKTIGAVFGPESVANKHLVGAGLHLLDDGANFETLMQLAIDVKLGENATDYAAVVNLLYENIVGFPPFTVDEARFVALLDADLYSVSSLGVLAAETALNHENIDLVGLSQTGIAFL